jgi:membrane protein YdbS with pleckstrin-like domain
MSPLRIIEYILLLVLAVACGYQDYKFGFHWTYSAGIVIPLIVIVLLLSEDRKR